MQRKRRKRPIGKRQVQAAKDAIVRYLGLGLSVTTACRMAGVSPRAYYNWLRQDEAFGVRVDEAIGKAISNAEAIIIQAIASGDVRTAMWYLERRVPEYRPPSRTNAESTDDYNLVIEEIDSPLDFEIIIRNGKQDG